MKYYSILFFIIILMISCHRIQNPIKLNPDFIESDFHLKDINQKYPNAHLTKVNEYISELNNNHLSDTIRLNRIVEFNGDPGDFHQIEIIIDGKEKWQLNNISGWVKFDQNYFVSEELKKQNQLNTDLLILSDFNRTKVIALFGWVYASYEGLISLIEFSNGEPRLMYSDNRLLSNIGTEKIMFNDADEMCWLSIVKDSIIEFCE